MFDFDVVIIDLNNIESFYEGAYYFDPNRFSLKSRSELEFIRNILRLRRELYQFVASGGVAFLFAPLEKTIIYEPSGDLVLPGAIKEYTGYFEISFGDVLGLEGIVTFEAKGRNTEVTAKSVLSKLHRKLSNKIEYLVHIEHLEWEPLLLTKGGSKVISVMKKYEKGVIFLLSNLSLENSEDDNIFIDCIRTAVQNLQPINEFAEVDRWAKEYKFLPELDLEKNLEQYITNLREAQAEVDRTLADLSIFREMKHLISGSGESLEIKVAEVFADLGFDVKKGELGRDDLIISKGERIAVVEIKGVKKSAAEKHAAQLEKWSATYFENNDVIPKPILVVNAFNETRLELRNENPFPNQMLTYSNARNHCLITTIQLLGMWLASKANPEKLDVLTDHLFETVGVFQNFSNFNEFSIAKN